MKLDIVTNQTPVRALELAYAIHVDAHLLPWQKSTFIDCFAAPYYGVLATDENDVLGYAIVLEVVDEATLMDIAVAKTLRGKGIGKVLVDFIIDTSSRRGMGEMWLEVRESNTAAIKLYEAYHFAHIEKRMNYYATATGKEHACIMKWEKP